MAQDSIIIPKALPASAPLIMGVDTLFFLSDVDSSFVGARRVMQWEQVGDSLLSIKNFSPAELSFIEYPFATEIWLHRKRLLSLYAPDTLVNKASLMDIAERWKSGLMEQSIGGKDLNELSETLKQFGIILIIIFLSYLIYLGVNRIYKWLIRQLEAGHIVNIKGFHYRSVEILNRERLLAFISMTLKIARTLVVFMLIYLLIPTVFSFFTDTRDLAYKLFSYIFQPLNSFVKSFFDFLPELILIGIMSVAAHYLIRFLKFWSREISEERLVLRGFYADWAMPTYNIIRFFIYLFVLVYILQHLPGSNAPLFLGFLALLGLTIALASSKPVSNFASGILLTYMRAFKVGDRVKVDDASGVVTDKNLFITRIKTKANEYITIPNSKMLDAHVINYSSTKDELGLIVYVEFTISRKIDFKTIEKDLVEAALRGDNIIDNPKPWLMISDMTGPEIKYKLAAYTQQAGKLERIKSSIYKQVYSTLREKGIDF